MQTKLDNDRLFPTLNTRERKANQLSLPTIGACAAIERDTEAAAAVELLRSRLDANGDWKGKQEGGEA